ncbi:MAG TPA: lasso peptide biosynthesis B2 protein [Aliidongia sp.]|uniref:lasso peptide biosynthesis B2 protein n=1 Tax=Aliidongia sp. TaxID=1914230 RepID=UPI002DDD6896|nr:lasso peptide biosynthesis B2 protein [Aliidongia sp.]HEV2677164.1 lasso peptide biosynthesis B2 protein [Aliidongia sp.]
MGKWYRIASTFRRLERIGRRRRRLLFEAALWLSLARASILIVPFRHLAPRIGRVAPLADGLTPVQRSTLLEAEIELVRDIGWAVTRAARYAPFEAVCLPQALAAKMMLRRRKVPGVLFFGAARRPATGRLEAHAWVLAAGVEVTGYPSAHSFTPTVCFV